jgi:hypothetical protein
VCSNGVVLTGAGPQQVAAVVNDGSTDNTTALQAAVTGGFPLLLPDNCHGSMSSIKLAGPLIYPGSVAQPITGSGWNDQYCTTTLNFTGTSYPTGAITLSSAANPQNQEFSTLDIQGSSSITSGYAIYTNATVTNHLYIDKVRIQGFPQAFFFNNTGNSTIQSAIVMGTAASANLPLVTFLGNGVNSNKIYSLQGGCAQSEFAQVPGVTFVSFGTPTQVEPDIGNEFHLKDVVGCPQVAYQNGGQVDWFIANTEARTGPILTVASGTADVYEIQPGSISWDLGPAIINAGNLSLKSTVHLVETPAPMSAQSQSATGGTYAAGTYYFWMEANGTLNTGVTTVNLNSGTALTTVTFASGSTNQVTFAFPAASSSSYPISNAASYSIWRNTTNSPSTAVLIASGVTGTTYTSTGSESTTATAPPDGNVPLILQQSGGTTTATCNGGRITGSFPTSNFNYGYMAMDDRGRYFNPCVAPEIPALEWFSPTPSAENAGALYQVLAAPGTNGQDALYFNQTTTTSSGTTYQWVNLWADSGVTTYTSSVTITSGTPAASLIKMNCSSACALTLTAQPYSTWQSNIVSVGSTTATLALHTGITWNGGSTAPVLSPGVVQTIWADSSTSTNFLGGSSSASGVTYVNGVGCTLNNSSPGCTVSTSTPGQTFSAGCTGTFSATAGSYAMYLAGQITSTGCSTSNSSTGSFLILTGTNAVELYCTAKVAGFSASSGVCSLYDETAAAYVSGVTCTIGTGTSCTWTGTVAITPTHRYGFLVSSAGTGETLGSATVGVVVQ